MLRWWQVYAFKYRFKLDKIHVYLVITIVSFLLARSHRHSVPYVHHIFKLTVSGLHGPFSIFLAVALNMVPEKEKRFTMIKTLTTNIKDQSAF